MAFNYYLHSAGWPTYQGGFIHLSRFSPNVYYPTFAGSNLLCEAVVVNDQKIAQSTADSMDLAKPIDIEAAIGNYYR